MTAGTLNGGSVTLTVGGNWQRTGGTFSGASGTVEFTGSLSINPVGSTFANLTKSGTGTATLSGTLAVTNNLTISGGAVTAAAAGITVGGSVTINSGGTLNGSAGNIAVDGNWNNSGIFTYGTGTVTFTGGGTHQITGDTTFYNFTCTAAGSTLAFGGGSEQTVSGTCTITGTSGSRITLTRISGANWTLSAGTTPGITYCDISYGNYASYLGWAGDPAASPCNAEGVAGTTGNFFTTFTWSTGATTTAWNTPANWAAGVAPPVNNNTTVITIPAGASFYPVLPSDTTIGKVTIAANASLDLAGWNFTATEVDNYGTLKLYGTQTTVNVGTKTNQTGSIVEYHGGGIATEKYGADYETLRINKTGGSWATTVAINAVAVNNPSTSGTITLSHDITVTTSVLLNAPVTLGAAAVTISFTGGTGAALTLNSTFDGASALTVNAGTGTVTLGDDIGDNTALTSLQVTGAAITINATTIETTGLQTYNGPVVLGDDLAIESAGGNVSFTNTVSNTTAHSLGIDAGTGSVAFAGAVGSGTALTSVTVHSANAGVTVSDSMAAGTVLLTSSGTIAIASSVTVAGGAGGVTFDGALSTAGPAVVNSVGSNITFTQNVNLGGQLSVSTGAGGGNIIFNGTVANSSAQTLALTPGTGTAIFKGNVGSGTELTAVTVAGASGIEIDGAVTIQTSGNIAFSGHTVTLSGTTTTTATLVSTGGYISLSAVSRAPAAGTKNLTLTAADSVTLNGAVGTAALPLGAIVISSADGITGISGAGTLTGASLSATAKTGISLTSTSNNVASVTLHNNVSGATGGILYNSGRGAGSTLTVTAVNDAADGDVTVTEATGAIATGGAIAGGGGAGVASFSSADDENITINSGHAISGFARLVLKAGDPGANTSTGDVIINAGITVSGSTPDGEGDTGATAAAVYIWTNLLSSGSGVTQTGAGGNVDIWYDTPVDPSYLAAIDVSSNRTYHLHPRHDKHIVYGALGPTSPGSIYDTDGITSIPDTDFYYYQSNASLGPSGGTFYSGSGKNIYILDVGDISPSNARAVTFTGNGNGFIEIRNGYVSSGLLTLNPGAGPTGGVRLNAATIDLKTNPFNINNANNNVSLYGGASSITAAGITLGGTVTSPSVPRNLTLVSTGAANNITVSGAVGTNAVRLGALEVTSANNISFSGAVYTTGAVTINNTGIFTLNSGANISAGGVFSQAGTGANNIAADITAVSAAAGTPAIRFAQSITLYGSSTFTATPQAAGEPSINIVGVTYNGASRNLVLAGGAGTVTLNDTINISGSFSKTGAGATVLAATTTNSITAPGISFAGPITGSGKNLTLAAGTGAITLSGTVGESAANQLTALTMSGSGSPSLVHHIYAASIVLDGTAFNLSQGAGSVLYANVTITAGNTVTVLSGTTVTQDPGIARTLTLNGTLNLDPSGGNWFIGPPSLPSPWYMLSNPESAAGPGADSNYINPGPQFTSGFAGFNGALTMGDGAVLNTVDFYTQITAGGHTFTLTAPSTSGQMCTITASGNVTINDTFVNVINSTLTMTGDDRRLAVRTHSGSPYRVIDARLGHFVAGGGGTSGTIINSSVRFNGDLTISAGRKLSSGISSTSANYIHMAGNGTDGSTWKTVDAASNFVETHSTVEFGEQSDAPPVAGGRTFTIDGFEGRSDWYNFNCYEPVANLKFSNYVSTSRVHRVTNRIEITPRKANGDPNIATGYLILLTREVDTGVLTPPGSPDYIPPEVPSNHFWYFDLASSAQMYMHFVYIQYSFSKNRIPLPLSSSTVIAATPYVYLTGPNTVGNYALGDPRSDSSIDDPSSIPEAVTLERSYYNVNWLVNDRFLYSFTEDSDGNGKIDRIRAQAAFDVTGSAENSFGNFRVVVEGYEVKGYARADEDTTTPTASGAEVRMKDMVYIYLKEKDYTDTGARPIWYVAANTTLKDLTTQTITINRPYAERLIAVDNAPPRINYALTVPNARYSRPGVFSGTDLGEIYVQFSEPVNAGAMQVTGIGGGAVHSDNIKPVNTANRMEFLIPLMAPYAVTDLAVPALPEFTLNKIQDDAEYAFDRRSDPSELYAYQYPSPKYPTDWTFSDYTEVRGDPLNGKPFDTVPPTGFVNVPGTVPRRDAAAGIIGSDTGNKGVASPSVVIPPLSHRVTDVLISSAPAKKNDPGFFVWPIWARYSTPPNNAVWGTNPQDTDTGIIWDFTGRKALEEQDTTLQVMRNENLTAHPQMYYGFNVPKVYRNPPEYNTNARGSSGLWLPDLGRETLPPHRPRNTFTNLTPAYFGPGYGVKTHDAAASAPPNHLYIYKFLKNDPGDDSVSRLDFLFHLAGTPADLFAARLDPAAAGPWYHRVRPFSYDIHDITQQRGGVTILNNVINPNKGEKTYIRYLLTGGGRVTIQVFTLDGNLVKVLRRENRGAGEWTDTWDGKNSGNRAVARGMYFIRVVAPDIDEIRKVMVVK
jgi:hypothetical protein